MQGIILGQWIGMLVLWNERLSTMIGAQACHTESLNMVKKGYVDGYDAFVTKADYLKALRAYQKKREETKSESRDEALVYEANPSLYWNFAKP